MMQSQQPCGMVALLPLPMCRDVGGGCVVMVVVVVVVEWAQPDVLRAPPNPVRVCGEVPD